MALKVKNNVGPEMYVTWTGDNDKQLALATGSKALQNNDVNNRSLGSNTFRNIIPNISIREGMSRTDYETYRSTDSIPEDNPKEIIRACNAAYKRIGIIRNVIDMMTDFAIKGVRITHSVKSWEKIGQEWAAKINLKDRCERFCNNLLRNATVIIKRSEAKISSDNLSKLQQGIASVDIDININNKKQDNVIPAKYTFINPLAVEITDDPLGYPLYWLRVNSNISKRIFS